MSRLLRPGWVLVALLVVILAAYATQRLFARASGRPLGLASAPGVPDRAVAPPGVRVRVQVLNATRTRGLARRATRYLRGRGFDVVEMGTVREQRDRTLVLDRSGHPAWAALVAEALGGASVEPRPDSARYLDVTVLLGASWRPPPESLDP